MAALYLGSATSAIYSSTLRSRIPVGFRKEEVTAELIRYGEWEERLAKEHALHMETARQKYNDTEVCWQRLPS